MSGTRRVSRVVIDQPSPTSAQGCFQPFSASAATGSSWTSNGSRMRSSFALVISASEKVPHSSRARGTAQAGPPRYRMFLKVTRPAARRRLRADVWVGRRHGACPYSHGSLKIPPGAPACPERGLYGPSRRADEFPQRAAPSGARLHRFQGPPPVAAGVGIPSELGSKAATIVLFRGRQSERTTPGAGLRPCPIAFPALQSGPHAPLAVLPRGPPLQLGRLRGLVCPPRPCPRFPPLLHPAHTP